MRIKRLQLPTDSWAFLSSVASWRRDVSGMALTVGAVEWTFARFLIALMPPAFLHSLAATIIPSSPDHVESWREFYFSIRLRYFRGWIVLAFLVALTSTIIVDLPVLHPAGRAKSRSSSSGRSGSPQITRVFTRASRLQRSS
jgi:hypothetical protein